MSNDTLSTALLVIAALILILYVVRRRGRKTKAFR
jgi:hypothetical protein